MIINQQPRKKKMVCKFLKQNVKIIPQHGPVRNNILSQIV